MMPFQPTHRGYRPTNHPMDRPQQYRQLQQVGR